MKLKSKNIEGEGWKIKDLNIDEDNIFIGFSKKFLISA